MMGAERQGLVKPTTQVAKVAPAGMTQQRWEEWGRSADPASDAIVKPPKPQFRGMSQELRAARSCVVVMPKLMIGAPGDRYEQEADRVAQQVVNQMHSQTGSEELKPSRGEIAPTHALQKKIVPMPRHANAAGISALPDLETAIHQERGSGHPLPDAIREPMEQSMGADFSGVRIHTDRRSDELNRSLQAQAFTTGQDVFFRQGAYAPQSHHGQSLIAHELTHVVQQNDLLSPHSLGSRQGEQSRTIQRQNTISGAVWVPDDVQAMIYAQLPIQALMALRATSKAQRQQIDTFVSNFIYKERHHIEQNSFSIFPGIVKGLVDNFLGLLKSLENDPSNFLELLGKSQVDINENISTAIHFIGIQNFSQDPEIYSAIGVFKTSGILRKGASKSDPEIEGGQYEKGIICRISKTKPTKRGRNPNFVQGASGEKKGNLITDLIQHDWMIVSITTKKGGAVTGCVLKNDVDCNWAEYQDISPEVSIFNQERNEPKAEDVKQGLIGDCFFQAALIAIVEKQPKMILDLFSNPENLTKPIGKNKITIHFYRKQGDAGNYTFIRESVTINPTLPLLNQQIVGTKRIYQEGERVYAQGPALWPALIEKAYAKWKGDYAQIDGGSISDCLGDLVGQEYKQISIDPDAGEELLQEKKSGRYSKQLRRTYDAIASALGNGEIVCLGTHEQWQEDVKGNRSGHSAGEPIRKGIAAHHAYTVIDVYQKKSGKLYLLVRNPWGKYGTVKIKQFGFSKRVIEKGEKGAISDIELSMLPQFFSTVYLVSESASNLETARKQNL